MERNNTQMCDFKNVCTQRKTRQGIYTHGSTKLVLGLGTKAFWIIVSLLYFPNCLGKFCCLCKAVDLVSDPSTYS